MSFLCFIKYSHSYFLGIMPTTPPALFLLSFYYIAIFKNQLNVHDLGTSLLCLFFYLLCYAAVLIKFTYYAQE